MKWLQAFCLFVYFGWLLNFLCRIWWPISMASYDHPPFSTPAGAEAAECTYASHLTRTYQVRVQPHGGATKKKKNSQSNNKNISMWLERREREKKAKGWVTSAEGEEDGEMSLCQLCSAVRRKRQTTQLICIFCLHVYAFYTYLSLYRSLFVCHTIYLV